MANQTTNTVRELTWRGFIIAFGLTILFTAANVYLGLKVGMTFATSIPAAVISMSILRAFRGSNILENNIVQTIASSAGTLSAVVFILPGLVMIGFWKGFPFWQTFLLCAIGGILGVMFTIPLRRALVVDSDLPYPEGTAAAETLKVGSKHNKDSTEATLGSPIFDISMGAILSFLFGLFSTGFRLLSDGISYYGKIGSVFSGAGFQFSFALIGAGYLIGIRVAIALLIGTIISWVIAVPVLAGHVLPHGQLASAYVLSIWSTKVRYIGAGTIGVATLWAILALLKPVYLGFKSSLKSMQRRSQGKAVPLHERDIPIIWVLITCLFLTLPLMAVFGNFIADYGTDYYAGFVIVLVVSCVFLVLFIGFLVAAVSGYMAGLVGSSNSPVSGIGILAIVVVSLFFTYLFHSNDSTAVLTSHTRFIIALAIFTTSAIYSAAAISNDNLQDLNTGHLVGATPWKQQVALVFGVIIGAMVLAPVLNQLYYAYGFVGALPRPGMDPTQALNAPQATLLTAIATGIIGHHLQWNMIFIGIAIGIVFLLLNGLILNAKKMSLSVLSMGIAIYLPLEITLPLIFGGILSYIVRLKLHKDESQFYTERCGTLFASGLIVGSSIFGILLAVLIGITGSQSLMALVGGSFHITAEILGIIVFLLICIYFVSHILRTQTKLRKELKS